MYASALCMNVLVMRCAIRSDVVPSGSPGKTLFKFLPSSKTRLVVRCSKPDGFAKWMMATLPLSSSGFSSFESSIAACMPTYSALWMPPEIRTDGPGFAPHMIVTGMNAGMPRPDTCFHKK